MGKIILNGIEYIGGEADNVFAPVIYSDVERVIGVWRDNKPLYAKSYTATITSGTQWIDTGLDSGDLIVKSEGTLEQNNGQILTLASGDTGAGAGINTFIVGIVTPSKWSCLFRTNSNDARGNLTLTLYYTKGSDVAGSGDYNTYGVPTVHYDTNEQVIGTYFGKPLYQKTATISGITISANSDTSVNISDYFANVAKAVRFECCDTNGDAVFPNVMVSSGLSPYSIGVTVDKASDHIVFTRGGGGSATISVNFTLFYTKTTD